MEMQLAELSEKEFHREQERKVQEIEQILVQFLPKEVSLQKTILEAMQYSLMAGGKRLRPMFMQEAHLLFSGTEKDGLMHLMATMEMIHTYSLVHDDLPAMDNDDYRRGKKTTHKVFGEDMGILCGDALLNYAYETGLKGIMLCSDKDAAFRAFSVIARKAGIYGMIGGQVVDVERTGSVLDAETLEFIYELKTGALLEASLMAGSELAGASEEDVEKMEQIGRHIGMAFQIQDDILDITSTTEQLGKPVHSDEKNQKSTYVTVYGMDCAKKAVSRHSEQALQMLQELSTSISAQNVYLNTLVRALVKREK